MAYTLLFHGSLPFLLHPPHLLLTKTLPNINLQILHSNNKTHTHTHTHTQSTEHKPSMALSTTTRPTFTFNLSTTQSSPPKPKPHFTYPTLIPKTLSISPLNKHPKLKFTPMSIDISKDDKPISEQPSSESPLPEPENFDKRRLEEKFAVLNTGIHECRSCGYRYDEVAGDPSYPIPPGLQFEKLPEDWRCATCGAAKTFFVSKSVEIAGFAQNQQFGLGGNALTSGQKAVLIYGTLLLFFVLFLSGYFLQ